jgi:hypothetical protein
MKNRLAPVYKFRLDLLKAEIIDGIIVIAINALKPAEHIDLEDNRGSLVINAIDDQQSEVIQCIERLDKSPNPDIIVVWSGVYEEENRHSLQDFEIPMLINILDALEAAIENE